MPQKIKPQLIPNTSVLPITATGTFEEVESVGQAKDCPQNLTRWVKEAQR